MTSPPYEVFSTARFFFSWGDWNGALTLITDNLAKIILLPIILIGTFHFPSELVYGRILPGIGLTLFIGLGLFSYLAWRLSGSQARSEITALPFGISTPVMFVYLFTIMGPAYFASNDPMDAYRIGLGAAFISGLIKALAAFSGPWLESVIPRPGLLGTIAGVALVWIAMVPIAIIFTNPLVGLPVLFVVLLGFIGKFAFPLRLPVGVVAIGLAVILGAFSGDSTLNIEHTGLYFPGLAVDDIYIGLQRIWAQPELLAILIPIEIYNFIEALGNVESARSTGDDHDIRTSVWVDGLCTCVGTLLGSPFPTTIYLGYPAYKQMGARIGYTFITGTLLLVASVIGLFAFLHHLIPAAGVSTLLVFVGVAMCQHAFQASAGYAAAVVIALLPHLADLLKKQLDGTVLEILKQGQVSLELAVRLAQNQGVYFQSYALLSHGAIITGLLWGSMISFMIDRDLWRAMIFSAIAFLLSLVGIIHTSQIEINFSPVANAYLWLTVILGVLHWSQPTAAADSQK